MKFIFQEQLTKATTRLTACVLVMILFAGCAIFTKGHDDADKYDETITNKVKDALQNEPSIDATQIKVKTYRGVVQLTGHVDSPADIRRAGDLAAAIPGTISVKNDLAVEDLAKLSSK